MSQKASKGIATIFAINILLLFAAISLFLFLSLFTYTITIARSQTVSKSRDSLIPLVLINSRYLDDYKLAVALSVNEQTTKAEIDNAINILSHIPTQYLYTGGKIPTICYKYSIGDASGEVQGFLCKDKYTFRSVFPFPQIFDGNNFVIEGLFESYM